MTIMCDARWVPVIQLTNLVRYDDHAEIDVLCLTCGWHEQVNLSLEGNAALGTPERINWMHAVLPIEKGKEEGRKGPS
jgi:hypothetical protein